MRTYQPLTTMWTSVDLLFSICALYPVPCPTPDAYPHHLSWDLGHRFLMSRGLGNTNVVFSPARFEERADFVQRLEDKTWNYFFWGK